MTKDTDQSYWVYRDVFERKFNKSDFLCRETADVGRYFLSSWFYICEDKHRWFYIPTVDVIGGSTQFINGRHRTAVLFNEIGQIPMAFEIGAAQEFAKSLELKPLGNKEKFGLPDLPVMESSA